MSDATSATTVDRAREAELGPVARFGSVVLLLLPTALLTAAAAHLDSRDLAIGAGIQAVFALLLCRQQPVWRPPVSASVIVLAGIAERR